MTITRRLLIILATLALGTHGFAQGTRQVTANASTGALVFPTAATFRSANGIGTGSGTVTSVGIATANGVSGSAAITTSGNLTLTLGAITPTSVNGLTLTTSTGTITLANSKVFTVSNTLTIAGTDGSTLNVGTGGTLGTAAFVAASDTAYDATSWNANTDVPTKNALRDKIEAMSLTAGTTTAVESLRDGRIETAQVQRVAYAEQLARQQLEAVRFTEGWTNLDAWRTAGVVLSSNKLYRDTGTPNPPAAQRDFLLAATDCARVRSSLTIPAASGASGGWVYIGFSTDATGTGPFTIATGGDFVGIGIRGTNNYTLKTTHISGSGTFTEDETSLGALATGTYIVDLQADEDNISLVLRNEASSVEYRVSYPRATLGTIRQIGIWNWDERTTSGIGVGPIAAIKSAATITPRIAGLEGTNPFIAAPQDSASQYLRIELPPQYDARQRWPVIIMCHGNQGTGEEQVLTEGRSTWQALRDAGYIIASSRAHDSNWGNQDGIDDTVRLHDYVVSHYSTGPVILCGVSMGGLTALNTLLSGRIEVAAFWGVYPCVSLAAMHGVGAFTAGIETAYDIPGGGNYATQTAGFDPALRTASEFRGVPMLMFASASDASVVKADNADALDTLIGSEQECTVTTHTGGHGDPDAYQTAAVLAFLNRVTGWPGDAVLTVNGPLRPITDGDTGTVNSTMLLDGTILNADIGSGAAIVDTKLATIATAGKVSNSATTAASANTASAIVARDGSGNFSAGTITANLTGTASGNLTAASLPGFINGFVLSNDATDASNDLDISAGTAVDSTGATLIVGSALVKRLDAAWAVGTNAGGLDTGAEATSTWYHVWAIRRSDTGVVDVLFSVSATAPTMPANYDAKRYLGSFYNTAGSVIAPFVQSGDGSEIKMRWTGALVLDVDVATLGNSTDYTLTTGVPPGFAVEAIMNVAFSDATSLCTLYVRTPGDNDTVPSQATAPLAQIRNIGAAVACTAQITITTDTSQQISARSSDTSSTLRIAVHSYRQTR